MSLADLDCRGSREARGQGASEDLSATLDQS